MFDNEHLITDALKELTNYYSNIDNGELFYSQYEKFQRAVEHIGYTLDYEPAFVKLNFEEVKNQYGNYHFQTFYKNYGINTAEIVEKSNLVFDKPEFKTAAIKSLEKGNIVKVKFELDDQVIEGKAVLNPQYKNLNLYDNDMNRINTNKSLQGLENENKHEKGNVRE
ncbi:hypothetical protein [Chryseobacterium sp. 7]|uniref:hypothetical protein n=1 Tax=Chryseobacterium sp. 7 TaxID=2035214 RepID=UPI0016005767|nr:hypothetical protein [Chryseobacterium sp. 7]